MVFSAAFVYWQKKNHGTGSIGWVLWWSRQWIKRLRRKLFISCFMKISAVIQTSVFLGAYQNDGSKSSFFFHTWNIFCDEMIHTHDLHAANWIIITEMYIIACRHTNDLCKCIHSLEMQSKFFFPSNNYEFAFAFTYTMQNCSCRWW